MILVGCLKAGCEKFALYLTARVRTLSKEGKNMNS
jgi:hypothetical protein